MSDQTVSNPQPWGVSAASFYADCKERFIIFHLPVDEFVVGKLLGIDEHDLIVECRDGGQVLIPKHAIVFVEKPIQVEPPPTTEDYY